MPNPLVTFSLLDKKKNKQFLSQKYNKTTIIIKKSIDIQS